MDEPVAAAPCCTSPNPREPDSFAERFMRQFSNPQGMLGAVAGWLMARKNGPLASEVAELVAPDAEARVLEVGFGPGLVVAELAARMPRGRVAGVDLSEVMLRQARRRNRHAVRAGQVDLRHACATALPFPDESFDAACSVNSLAFWPSSLAGLREIRRVLRPGGRVVIALRRRREGGGRFDRSARATSDARISEIEREIAQAGLRDVSRTDREVAGESIACFVARR